MVKMEVLTYKQANDALQKPIEEQMTLKGEVQDLSQQLHVTWDKTHNLSMDLATKWSLLDTQPRRKHDNNRVNTSKGHKEWPEFGVGLMKGKKIPIQVDSKSALNVPIRFST